MNASLLLPVNNEFPADSDPDDQDILFYENLP